MPWDANSFSLKHNHKLGLNPKAARGASEAANKALASGKTDASAIRIGNYVGDKVMNNTKSYAKGGDMDTACSYAKGGPVLGRARSFMKEGDPFRGTKGTQPGTVVGPTVQKDVPQDYKGGKGPHKDKSKSPPMPGK